MVKISSDLLFVIEDTIKRNKQVIVFVPSKRSAEANAEAFAKKFKHLSTINLKSISQSIKHTLSNPTKQCERLSFCVDSGFAFHHSGLVNKQRGIIEDNFRSNQIRVIFATPTLAMGVDMPAFRTVMTSLKRYGGDGYNWIPVMEYLQMAGRAGRKGKEDFGESIVISKSETEKEIIKDKFLYAEPEPIYSKLAVEPVLRTYLLSLISMNIVNTKESIMNFFSKTFFAKQYLDKRKLIKLIEKQLVLLEDFNFVEIINKPKKTSMFETAVNLIKKNVEPKYNATMLGQLVSRLYLDPISANKIIKTLNEAKNKIDYLKENPFVFIVALGSLLELRPLFSVGVKDETNQLQTILLYDNKFLFESPLEYDIEFPYFMKSIKFSRVITDWINEVGEDSMMDKFNIRPGELKAKLNTFDWILYSCLEFVKYLRYSELLTFIGKLRLRVSNGVKLELLNLLKLKKIGKKRARKLYNNGFKNVGDIKESDFIKVSSIIGNAIAIDIFKQLGLKHTDIPISSLIKSKPTISLNSNSNKTLFDF